MAGIKRGDVVEMQQSMDGEQQPIGKEDALAPENFQLAQDSADMRRLGRSQQLTVFFSPRVANRYNTNRNFMHSVTSTLFQPWD